MRVDDVAMSIYKGLRALDLRRYRCAMWLVCGNLRAVYEDLLSDAERTLMTSTLEMVRDVVMAGEVSVAGGQEAMDLYAKWWEVIDQGGDDVMSGHVNTWMVFRDLAGEFSGEERLYESTERVGLAAMDRWRGRIGPIIDDFPGQVVDDSTPMARTLNGLQGIVVGVTRVSDLMMQDMNWDPVEVRSQIIR